MASEQFEIRVDEASGSDGDSTEKLVGPVFCTADADELFEGISRGESHPSDSMSQ
jgi:hypothetical protein